MSTPFNQGGQGEYIFGDSATPTTVFDTDIMHVSIKVNRDAVTKPATYGNPVIEDRPGSIKREMQIEYLGDPTDAASFFNLLHAQVDADGYVYFDVKFQDGTVSATNPRYTGRIFVNEVVIGAAVNELWESTVTYPIVDYVKVTS